MNGFHKLLNFLNTAKLGVFNPNMSIIFIANMSMYNNLTRMQNQPQYCDRDKQQ